MYPSPSPSHAWNSFRTRSSSQMEPVSLSASAVCDIFSLEIGLGRLATNGRHRYSCRSVAAAVVRLVPHLPPDCPPNCVPNLNSRPRGGIDVAVAAADARLSRDTRRRVPDARRMPRHGRYRDSSSISVVSEMREKSLYYSIFTTLRKKVTR